MICPRCLNEDPSFFAYSSRGWYCRKCIGFSRVLVEERLEEVNLLEAKEEASDYFIAYPLSEDQKRVSHACLMNVLKSDVLIHAVCGAGKTEIVVETIAYALEHKLKICFAIARRQVVLELKDRLSEIFSKATVVAVCGGHTSVLDGDLIVCTTHQLYRYYQAFDILILDEPDAFPFYGSPTLHGIAKTACRGHRVFLTATPDETLLKGVEDGTIVHLQLNKRPHGHALPVPVVRCGPLWYRLFVLLKWLDAHCEHPRMVFVPTIQLAKYLHFFLSKKMDCYMCTSKSEERDLIIDTYRKEKNGVIVCTTVLERGVTVPFVDVCVYLANHSVYNLAALIQMAGRAGRSFKCPDGDVLFVESEQSDVVYECVWQLKEVNQDAL